MNAYIINFKTPFYNLFPVIFIN